MTIYLTKSFKRKQIEYNDEEMMNFKLENITFVIYISSFFMSISCLVWLIEIMYSKLFKVTVKPF